MICKINHYGRQLAPEERIFIRSRFNPSLIIFGSWQNRLLWNKKVGIERGLIPSAPSDTLYQLQPSSLHSRKHQYIPDVCSDISDNKHVPIHQGLKVEFL